MEIGTEISQKIRAAIKAKLVDLGAYVDDELPDYIMVMVANKKTQQQMKEDLSLFLSDNATKFCSWLHSLLEKLQSLTLDTDSALNSQEKIVAAEHAAIQPPTEPPPAIELDITEQTDEFAVEMEKTKKAATPDAKTTVKVTTELPKTVKQSPQKCDQTSPVVEKASEPKKVIPVKVSPKLKVSPVLEKLEHRSSRPTVVAPVRNNTVFSRISGLSRNTVTRKRKALGSTLGAVINHSDEEDEGYDPHFPAVGNVASVIKVTARKSSIPRSLQANTSLLVRAMQDAQKSVSSKKKLELEEEPESKPKRLLSRSRRQEMIRKLAQTVQEEYDPDDNYQITTDDDVLNLMSTSEDSRQFVTSEEEKSASDLNSDYEPELQKLEEVEDVEQRRVIKQKKIKEKEKLLSPRFIVTLDGVDPKSMGFSSSLDDTLGSEVGDMSSAASDGENESTSPPATKTVRLQDKCKFYPNCMKGATCPYQHPTVPCKTFPKCKFGDKCSYIHPPCKFAAACTKPNCPFTHTQKKTSLHPTVIPNAYIITKPRFVSVMPVSAQNSGGPKSSRDVNCKFFPNCTNMNCPFNHPLPCRFGFSCKSGSKCTFYHAPLPKASQMKWKKETVSPK